jgi:hypothetical protein
MPHAGYQHPYQRDPDAAIVLVAKITGIRAYLSESAEAVTPEFCADVRVVRSRRVDQRAERQVRARFADSAQT